jgi:hypothetical protein
MQAPPDKELRSIVGFAACVITAAVLATPMLGIWPALVVVGTAVAIGYACQAGRKKGDAAGGNGKPVRRTLKSSRKRRVW